MDTGTRPGRSYLRRLFTALAAYAVVLAATVTILNVVPDAPWRFVVAALPIVPLLFVGRAVARFITEADELQGRIQLEARAFGFGVGSLVTFSYGLLEGVGLPRPSWLFVWPVYAACWMVGVSLAKRRY